LVATTALDSVAFSASSLLEGGGGGLVVGGVVGPLPVILLKIFEYAYPVARS
jgi:hypothetical protein